MVWGCFAAIESGYFAITDKIINSSHYNKMPPANIRSPFHVTNMKKKRNQEGSKYFFTAL